MINTNFLSFFSGLFRSSTDRANIPQNDPTLRIRPDSLESEELMQGMAARSEPLSTEEDNTRNIFQAQVTDYPTPVITARAKHKKFRIKKVYDPLANLGRNLLKEDGVRRDLKVLASPVGKNDHPFSGKNFSPFTS